MVVVDFHAVLRKLLGKIIRRARKIVVAYDVSDHFLIEITVLDMIPVSILSKYLLFFQDRLKF